MTDLFEFGDSIEGERIVCTYKKKINEELIRRTNDHRGTQSTIKDAYCVITKPIRPVQ